MAYMKEFYRRVRKHFPGKGKKEPLPPFDVPQSTQLLRVAIDTCEASKLCNCDICAPELYVYPATCRNHLILSPQHLSTLRNLAILSFHPRNKYEAMQLVQHLNSHLDQLISCPTPEQTVQIQQLQSILHVWKPHLNGKDARRTMSEMQVTHLVKLLNAVFFASSIQRMEFHWRIWPDVAVQPYGMATYHVGSVWRVKCTIETHPTKWRSSWLSGYEDGRMIHRIGNLIHELLHLFFGQYACRKCPTFVDCLGEGHGRAWMIGAKKLEEVVPRVLGIETVILGRWTSFCAHMRVHRMLPSRCDVERYALG